MSGTTNVIATALGSAASVSASASDATTVRSLNSWLSDAVFIEAFGGNGNGTADNSAALTAAIASGKAVRFGPNTYKLNGPFTISSASAVVLIGSPGQTVLLGGTQTSGSAWITVSAATLFADGITFNANTTTVNVSGVSVTKACSYSDWNRCSFSKATSSGIVVQNYESTSTAQRHSFTDCEAFGNDLHGIYVQAVTGLQISGSRCYSNAGSGINFDYAVSDTGGGYSLYGQIIGNRCWGNRVGISVGDYLQENGLPGPLQPDAQYCLIQNNICYGNTEYGIVAQGQYLLTDGNTCYENGASGASTSGGILANSSNSRFSNNVLINNYSFGVDAGGSASIDVNDNYVTSSMTTSNQIGINIGGSQSCRVSGNYISGFNYYGVVIYNIESNAGGSSFPSAANGIVIADNDFYIPNGADGGILVLDGAQGVMALSNRFTGLTTTYGAQCILALTDNYIVANNLLNGQAFPTTYAPSESARGYQAISFPDIVDGVVMATSASPIQQIISINAINYAGKVTFVKVTDGGSGFTTAPAVSFSGGGGSGAEATALLYGGVVVGVEMNDQYLGSGYTSAPTVAFSGGGGSGATATAFVGLLPPANRILRLICQASTEFATTGSSPNQSNWTGAPITVPAGTAVDWMFSGGGGGQWTALNFQQSDYVQPNGSGGVALHSVAGNVMLHPGGSGVVQWISDSQSTGCTTSIGSGSPQGVVTAPPGSDYRNLTGTVGSVFWIKQTGTGNTGWVAIA